MAVILNQDGVILTHDVVISLCYFNQSLNFISANSLVASVATYTDKLASVFRTWVSAVHREYH